MYRRSEDCRQRVLVVAGLDGCEQGPSLGLGDLIRVITLLPAIKADQLDWCSPPQLFALAKDCPCVCKTLDSRVLAQVVDDYDFVLNLTFVQLNNTIADVLEISDVLGGKSRIKERTYDLPRLLSERLSLVYTGNLPFVSVPTSSDFDIGFNWCVPLDWQTKELPQSTWIELEEILSSRFTISWQTEGSDLEEYIGWVRGCKLLVSIVGLGCHLSMFYGRQLLMLSAPTDFSEVHHYCDARVMYPANTCKDRPCYRKFGEEHCPCMAHFRAVDIAEAATNMLDS